MIEFKCGEQSTFEFEMQISGDAGGAVPCVKFCIDAGDVCHSFTATPSPNSGVYTVTVPCLEKYLGIGTYPCKVCVVLGSNYYEPMVGECSLISEPKPVVGAFTKVNMTAKPTVAMTMPSNAVQAPTITTGSVSMPQTSLAVEESQAPVTTTVAEAKKPESKTSAEDQQFVDMLLKRVKNEDSRAI